MCKHQKVELCAEAEAPHRHRFVHQTPTAMNVYAVCYLSTDRRAAYLPRERKACKHPTYGVDVDELTLDSNVGPAARWHLSKRLQQFSGMISDVRAALLAHAGIYKPRGC